MSDTLKDIKKKYGDGIIQAGQFFLSKPKKILSVSPAIDIILGGGIPEGSIWTLAGAEKCGKTTTALHFCAKAQKDDRPIYFFNIEGRLKTRDLQGIRGLNIDKVNIVGSYLDEEKQQGKILSAEEYLEIARQLIHNEPRSVIILDSISQLCASEELAAEVGERKRAPGAILMAQFLKQTSNVIAVNNIVLIGILHLIANTSGYGAQYVESGGKKIKYASDITMRAKAVKPWVPSTNENAEPIGQIITWQTSSTALAPPGRKMDSHLRYGYGLDELAELLEIGVSAMVIQQNGGWYTWKEKKYQGKAKLAELFNEDKEAFEELRTSVLKMFVL